MTTCDGVHPPPYRHLDPGVRELVRELVGHGFTTIDSGDGVSKPASGRVLDFLHVFMRVQPVYLVEEADRLQGLLSSLSVSGLVVEASYRPDDGHGIIALLDLKGVG